MNSGTLIVKTYVSNANIPLSGVLIYVTDTNNEKIGIDITNKIGLTQPITIDTPNEIFSENPNSQIQPYTLVNVYASKDNYYLIKIENLQIFDGVQSIENIQMLPLPENEQKNAQKIIVITPQPLTNQSN